jgi:ParB-like chromosome segregation protein Spo0J
MAVETIEKLRVHPSCKDNRALTEQESDELRAAMQRFRRTLPIIVWRQAFNKETSGPVLWIVDGRHRYEMAIELGWKTLLCEEFDGAPEDAKAYAMALNRARRHEPLGKRALDAARECNMGEGHQESTAQICAVSQTQAAESHHVSRGAVQQAKKVLEQGTPELIAAVESGTIAVSKAAASVTKPETKQRDRCGECGRTLP